jgi:hypothetical protein
MSDPTQAPLGADASQDEIEADIAATRARLAESVDALADKMDVKTQAKDKVADVKAQAADKVTEVRNTAQAKVVGAKVAAQEKFADLKATAQDKFSDVKATAQDKVGRSSSSSSPTPTGIPTSPVTVAGPTDAAPSRAAGPVPGGTKDQLVATSQQLWTRVKALPLVGQIAAGAVPLLVAVLLVERRKKD